MSQDNNNVNLVAAAPKEARKRLRSLALSDSIRKNQRRVMGTLMELFDESGSVPMPAVLDALYPGEQRQSAQMKFRKLKQRLNDLLRERGVPLALASHGGCGPAEQKLVWLEDLDPAGAAARRGAEAAEAVTRTALERGPAEPDAYIEPLARIQGVPIMVFPEYMEMFCREAFPGAWAEMPESGRRFFLGLAAKFEPLRKISPHPDTPREAVGFEVLAEDEAARSFLGIEAFARSHGFDPAMHLLCLLFSGLMSIRHFLAMFPLHEGRGGMPGGLIFTMNLDPRIIGHPAMRDLCRRWRPLFPERFVFEVKESFPARLVDDLLEFQNEFGFAFALDDLDETDPAVRRALEPHACITKLGFRKTRPLLAKLTEDPEAALIEMKRFKLEGRPLVVEAVAEDISQLFLYHLWREDWGELYAQGRGLDPGPRYEPHFEDLADYGTTGGGFFLSAPMLDPAERALESAARKACLVIRDTEAAGDTAFIELSRLDSPGRSFSAALWRPGPGAAHVGIPETLKSRGAIITTIETAAGEDAVHISRLAGFFEQQAHLLAPENAEDGVVCPNDSLVAEISDSIYSPDRTVVCDALNSLSRWAGLALDTEDRLDPGPAPVFALLGDSGAGRSALCRRFARALLEAPSGPAPLLLDLESISSGLLPGLISGGLPGARQIISLAAGDSGPAGGPAEDILSAAHEGRVIVIFDNIEEVLLRIPPARAAGFLKSLAADCGGGAGGRVLISCRTHYFLDNADELGRLPSTAAGAPFRLWLKRLNPGQTAEFLEARLGEKTAGRLVERLGRPAVPGFGITRPCALEILAAAARGRPQIPPDTLAGAAVLLGRIAEERIARDAARRRLRGDLAMLMLEHLAMHLLNSARESMHYEELYSRVRREAAEELPGASIEELEAVDSELRAASLLVRGADGMYRFAAPAMLDWFGARAVARALRTGDTDIFAALPGGRSVMRLAAAMSGRPPFNMDASEREARRLIETGHSTRAAGNLLEFISAWRAEHGA